MLKGLDNLQYSIENIPHVSAPQSTRPFYGSDDQPFRHSPRPRLRRTPLTRRLTAASPQPRATNADSLGDSNISHKKIRRHHRNGGSGYIQRRVHGPEREIRARSDSEVFFNKNGLLSRREEWQWAMRSVPSLSGTRARPSLPRVAQG
ncbi:hypothetical protein ACJJTC_007820 [Scirpophaga incertulas]